MSNLKLNQTIILQHINFLHKEIKGVLTLNIHNPKISFFSSSQCNYLYLLQFATNPNQSKYLCKICTWQQNEIWQIKKTEFDTLKSIEHLGISPKVYYYNLGDNYLGLHWNIVEYIKGTMVDKLTNNHIIQLGKILHQLHSSNQSKYYGEQFPPAKQGNYISTVFKDMDNQIQSVEYDSLKDRFDQINWSNINKFCLIHNDLKEYNMILDNDNNIKLIDWEYAYYDIPENDIARLIIENSLTKLQIEMFLKEYLPINNIGFDMTKLQILIDVYEFFGINKRKIKPKS